MSFGSRQLDEAFDRWLTTPPEGYDGECEDEKHELCDNCGACHVCDEGAEEKCKKIDYGWKPE